MTSILGQDWEEKTWFQAFANFALSRARRNVRREMKKAEGKLKDARRDGIEKPKLQKEVKDLKALNEHFQKFEGAETSLVKRSIQLDRRVEEDMQMEIELLTKLQEKGFPPGLIEENAEALEAILKHLSADLQNEQQHFANLKNIADNLLSQVQRIRKRRAA